MKTKIEMPGRLKSQLQWIKDVISKGGIVYKGGYFYGTSKNKYYAKKQHKNFCEKLTKKMDFFTINFN